MVRETHRVQLGMRGDVNGILFGFDVKDNDLIKFSSLRVKNYQEYGTEWGAAMRFLLLDKGN